MAKKSRVDETALKNKCPACNASISFNPSLDKWKCDYCGSSFSLEELKKFSDNASTDNANKKVDSKEEYNDYVSYRCESCGAEIVADAQTAATFCVYCGNTAILKSKLTGKFNPDYIIPFKCEKEDAIEAFKSLPHGRPLVPKKFSDAKNIEKIRGVYIPFWLFDIGVNGDINVNATRVTSWTSGDIHYTKTDHYKVVRGGTMNYKLVPVDGSSRFDNNIMNSIEPFDYKGLVKYNHAYFSGFYAERYDIASENVFDEVSDRAIYSSKHILLNDIRFYDTKNIISNTLKSSKLNCSYAMLPVWMVNVKYKDKLYTFAMNGQTKKFIGNIPIDKPKAIFYTIVIFLLSFVLAIGGSYLFFKLGGH